MGILDVRMASITSVSELIRKREISPVEVIDAFLERIEAVQKGINAFITVLEAGARRASVPIRGARSESPQRSAGPWVSSPPSVG
jgi:Asp-tRNA(Asn)/Glu-tRNA(Gln) amidotransferase A subunit family amidase